MKVTLVQFIIVYLNNFIYTVHTRMFACVSRIKYRAFVNAVSVQNGKLQYGDRANIF